MPQEKQQAGEVLTQRDIDAFPWVHRLHYQPLYHFARRMIGNTPEAEDIVNECIYRLFGRKGGSGAVADVRGFLYTSVRNSCFNYLRARERTRRIHRELIYLSMQPGDVVNDEIVLLRVFEQIHIELEKLPPHCREIFGQVFFRRQTTAQIAAAMGISPQTVLNQKNKATTLIRSALLKKDLGPSMWVDLSVAAYFGAMN